LYLILFSKDLLVGSAAKPSTTFVLIKNILDFKNSLLALELQKKGKKQTSKRISFQ
jgi:hypothetical protein